VLWNDLMMLNNFVILHLTSVVGLGFLNIVVLLLGGMETLNFMSGHGVADAGFAWDVLNETNHSLATLGVKLIIIT